MKPALIAFAIVVLVGASLWQVEHSLGSLPDNAHWPHLGPFPLAPLLTGLFAIFCAGLTIIVGLILRSRHLMGTASIAAFAAGSGGALIWVAISLRLNHYPYVAQVVYAVGLAICLAIVGVISSRMRRNS